MQRQSTYRKVRLLGAILSLVVVSALLTASPVSAQTVMCGGVPATIVGTPGNDTLNGTPGPDVIAGLQGDDRIFGGAGDDIICGGLGDDLLRGGDDFDIIFGAQGNDEIFASFGESESLREDTKGARMFGGAGDDIIHGSNKWDRMQGGLGNDILRGYEGRDWMRGGGDRDDVSGGPGVDDLHGGNGSDRIAISGADIVKGGAGIDMCILASQPAELRSCGRNRPEASPRDGTISFGAGTYLVGREVPIGLYRTSNYWQLDDAENRTVINDFQFDGPSAALVDERGATIEFRQPANKIDAKTPRLDPFQYTRGRFLVGLDLAPGVYRVRQLPTTEFNALVATYDVRGRVLDIGLGQGSVLITVGPEAAFFEFGFGTLERVAD